MMPSSEAFDLVSVDANNREYKRYVEMLIARGLLDKNAMIVADKTLYCGFPSALSESCFLEEIEPKTRSNTKKTMTRPRFLLVVSLFPVPASPAPGSSAPGRYERYCSHMKK